MAIRHKRKTTTGYTWQTSDLVSGQIGVNTVDGTLHLLNNAGTSVFKFIDQTAIPSGGSSFNDPVSNTYYGAL